MELRDLQLKERRQALGLSQVELATRAGISLPTLQNLESGKAQNPSLDVLNRLAQQLGLQLAIQAKAPDWDYLAACGVPLLSTRTLHAARWEPQKLRHSLQLALPLAAKNSRERAALMAFAHALFDHYPQYAERHGFHFLKKEMTKNQPTGEILKLRRLALAHLQKVL